MSKVVCFLISVFCLSLVAGDSFEETLYVKRLRTGQVYAHFEFVIKDVALSNHTRLFPRILAEILEVHSIQEMHFSLTQGYWRTESWGIPHVSSPTGAHLSAWFLARDKTYVCVLEISTVIASSSGDKYLLCKNADKNWNGFTSRLSGLTCASLNFLDTKTSIEPRFAYRPQGKIKIPESSQEQMFLRVGNLPRENVCTENLTPWSKLLPCGLSRGLASLLRSKQVFNTHYHSEGIQFIQTETEIMTKLTLTLVLDIPKSLKGVDNFPKRVLGSLAIFPCFPASSSTVKVWDGVRWNNLDGGSVNSMRLEDVPAVNREDTLIFTPVKYMGGYGQEYGTMIVELTNHLTDQQLSVLYVEVLPWFIRPYLHTMEFKVQPVTAKVNDPPGTLLHYTPGLDRAVLHKMEMGFVIPPKSTITVAFLVEKGHLKWNEYPPDANHGFYLEAAHFEVNITGTKKQEPQGPLHYYSRILLVNLSTPDFSMPYNVICLTCTVVALAFGPIHNITTKQLKLSLSTPKGKKLRTLAKRLMQLLRLSRKQEKQDSTDSSEICAEVESSLDPTVPNLPSGGDKQSDTESKKTK